MIDKDTIKLLMKKDSALNIYCTIYSTKIYNLSSGENSTIKKLKAYF